MFPAKAIEILPKPVVWEFTDYKDTWSSSQKCLLSTTNSCAFNLWNWRWKWNRLDILNFLFQLLFIIQSFNSDFLRLIPQVPSSHVLVEFYSEENIRYFLLSHSDEWEKVFKDQTNQWRYKEYLCSLTMTSLDVFECDEAC